MSVLVEGPVSGSHQGRRPKRPHSRAGCIAAPERFAQSRIPLAPQAPSIHDPMYGPAVRRKRFSRSVGFAVLHQCIRPLIGACCAPGHHGYQRAWVLIRRQASNGAIWVTRFRRRREDRSSISFILSQTSAGKRGLCHLLSPDQCSSFVRAISRSFVPACACSGASRAGAVKAWPSRSALHHVCVSRPGLDGREHLTQVGMKAQLPS